MVEAGEWRATKPEVKGHAGFRLNALISMFANAAWPELVKEFEQAEKNGDADMQPFFNTVLGKTWARSLEKISEDQLMARREDFSLVMLEDKSGWIEKIPADVCYITAGVDPGGDRVEITLLGHSPTHRFVLGHIIVFGSPNFETTWDEVRAVLTTSWKHPFGGTIGVEAAGVDSGGHWTQKVYDFCENLQGLKIFAIKGDEGPRKAIEISKKRRRNRTAPLYIVGVDSIKTDIVSVLPKDKEVPQSIRLSNTLGADYMLQLTAERRVRKYKLGSNRPFISFERIGKRRAEALDCLVYAIAIKEICRFDFEVRSNELRGSKPKKLDLRALSARLNGR
jgi:phage terminase large subunit GpA-like protein